MRRILPTTSIYIILASSSGVAIIEVDFVLSLLHWSKTGTPLTRHNTTIAQKATHMHPHTPELISTVVLHPTTPRYVCTSYVSVVGKSHGSLRRVPQNATVGVLRLPNLAHRLQQANTGGEQTTRHCTLRSWGLPHRTGPWCSTLGRTQAPRPPSYRRTTRHTCETKHQSKKESGPGSRHV